MPVSALDMPSSLSPLALRPLPSQQDLLEEVGRGLRAVEGLGCDH